MRAVRVLLVFVALLGLAVARPAAGRVFASRDQALKEAFPEADSIQPHDLFLTLEQRRELEQAAGAPQESDLVTLYEGRKGGQSLGCAVLDTQLVRTMPETLLIVVDPQGRVTRAVMCAFAEPEEYLPAGRWFEQFKGKSRRSELRVGRDVAAVSGCTLTARAVTVAVRRTLAVRELWLRTPREVR